MHYTCQLWNVGGRGSGRAAGRSLCCLINYCPVILLLMAAGVQASAGMSERLWESAGVYARLHNRQQATSAEAGSTQFRLGNGRCWPTGKWCCLLCPGTGGSTAFFDFPTPQWLGDTAFPALLPPSVTEPSYSPIPGPTPTAALWSASALRGITALQGDSEDAASFYGTG